MLEIDKKDSLYNYLQNLGVEDLDKTYLSLAKDGRYKRADVISYWQSTFRPSNTNDIDEKDLEMVVDYYVDLKKVKTLTDKQLNQVLKEYKKTNNNELKDIIINSQLKDVMYLCLNYLSFHKDENIQDLIQDANIGLMQAVDKYNEKARISFKDYVIYWVRNSIIHDLGENND